MKIKNVSLLLLVSCFFISCLPPKEVLQNKNGNQYKNKYKEFLDQGSLFLIAGYNFMMEYTVDGKYVQKYFYPDTKQITHYTTYSDKELKTRNGLSKEWWDDGFLVFEGIYKNNKRVGNWVENKDFGKSKQKGIYENGKKEGLWKVYSMSGKIREEVNYRSNKKHGAYKIYNRKGELAEKGVYKNGKIVEKEILDKTHESYDSVEEMPQFKGCESIKDIEARKTCAEDKMLHFIYGNIRYPYFAREEGIEGRAYINFIINKEGKIVDVKTLRGVCKEIKAEVLRILEKMPDWHPGKQNGKPVKVSFTLPVSFKLQ